MIRKPRAPKPTDFTVSVEGVGRFVFGKRTMADELAIQREYADIIQGVERPTVWLDTMGGWLSALRVLTVSAPDGWDLDELDPLDEQTYANLNRVYEELRNQERSFRGGQKPAGEGTSA
jgi:hypothetical protein